MSVENIIRVLLVEDDEDDYFLFKTYLNDIKLHTFALTWAKTYEEALDIILKREHDIYFYDYMLGAHTGLDLLKFSLTHGIDAPVILLTGLGNHETDIKAMEFGAADFITKSDINAENLERSIRYAIEQSRNLKKIKESEAKFRSIFENSHDVIYITNQNGKILEINSAGEHLFGYTREELLEMNSVLLFENINDYTKFIKAVNKTGARSNFEVSMKDRFGNKKYCTITSNIQKIDKHGNIIYQGIIHDMTLRKKAEQDLMIAEKLAITGKIARSLAHEIRNPLTNINLAADHLHDEIKKPYDESYFEIIKRNSSRINELVTELMENSRLAELKISPVPLKMILDNSVALVKDRTELKKIKIETDFNGNNALIEADENKLTLAILNIINNAIEAVEENKGVIKIASVCNDNKCVITVEDNGCGIEKNNLSHIFEPYFTAMKSNGMGLGLATTHNLISTHKGTIDVESVQGKGTKFNINLNLI